METNEIPWIRGEYKQWNGLLEWNTGLDYWNEFFDCFCLFA